jgi:hypothetical protein
MEVSPNDSIKSEPGISTGYESNGPTLEEPVRLSPEEYAMVANFRNQQRVASRTHPSQVPLPTTPVHSTSAGLQAVGVPSVPGYQTVTTPDALVASIFVQITHREMQARWNQEQAERSRAATNAGLTPELKAMFDQSQPVFGLSTIKQMKLGIKKFDGEEVYKGLGPNFTEWGLHFMKRIPIAQIRSGFWWRSENKVDCQQAHLSGKALRHFETQSPELMRESPHLEFVMIKLLNAFTVKLTLDQASDIFRRPKPKNRAWNEHYIYLTEVSHSAGGMPRHVLDGILKYAVPELKPTLLAKANMETATALIEAERMANFAQSMTMEERPARALGRHINAIEESSISAAEAIVCSYCKRKSHAVEECH